MIFTEEKATDLIFPNITVHKRFRDGELCAYIASANEGYAMYDKNAKTYETEDSEGEPVKATYYFERIICPLSFNFDSFSWEAVRKDSIDTKYLF